MSLFFTPRRVLGLKKDMLTPDDFLTPQFEVVWKSRSVPGKTLRKVVEGNLGRMEGRDVV